MTKVWDWRGREYMSVLGKDGKSISMVTWSGHGALPRKGDRLILRHSRPQGTRYVVTGVQSALAEGDVVTVDADYDPRTVEQVREDWEFFGEPPRRDVLGMEKMRFRELIP